MLRTVQAAVCCCWVSAAAAATDDYARCASIAVAADRLACYDRAAGRPGPAARPAAAAASEPAAEAPPTAVAPPPLRGPVPEGDGVHPVVDHGLLSRYWELDPDDKRGTFNFSGFHPNFLLPLHATSHLNTLPQSPTHPATPLLGYRKVEAKLQLSLRTKLIQGLLLPDGDLWFGYTQQSFWQIWTPQESSPFRSTDYMPELIYVAPVPEGLRTLPAGWRWRMVQLGIAHQSNGQTDPLSRSWNRINFGLGFDRDDVSLVAHAWKRLPESADDNDNPDLTSYIGRGDLVLAWTPGLSTASLTWRTTLKSLHRGSLQFDWTYPVKRDQPNGLRWYAQVFSGYGETLLDYNFRQTSLGLGVTLFNF